MTKKLMIIVIAIVTVLLGISIFLLFFMPSDQVYNGVLIEHGLREAKSLQRMILYGI